MEAAFFDLDKTIIAKSSVLAFGRPLYREGLISRSAIARSVYAQLVYMLVGLDKEHTSGRVVEPWPEFYARQLIERFGATRI